MSHKNRDEKNRWRNKTIAFRVSPEENDLINARVVASGLTKQEFLTSNMLNARITVRGSSRVYYGLQKDLELVYGELKRIATGERVDRELISLVKFIAKIIADMKEGR